MIVMDMPRLVTHLGERKHHCHVISTVNSLELVLFCHQLKIPARWIQDRGQRNEHLDLFNSKIRRAVKLGIVQVSNGKLVEYIQAKERHMAEIRAMADRLEGHLRERGKL